MSVPTPIAYSCEGISGSIDFWEGHPEKPVILLLHGMGGSESDMTTPGLSPDRNYDYTGTFPPDRDVGWADYPGVGVWSFTLDSLKNVTSWREVLVGHGFRTAAYSQIDPAGIHDRPVVELACVIDTLVKHFPETKLVLLAHSRGGLIVRKLLKDRPQYAAFVSMVITLHSPHQGSALANYADALKSSIDDLRNVIGSVADAALGWLLDLVNVPAYQELAIGSPFLTDLAQGEGPLPGVQYFTFGGTSVLLARILAWVYTLGSAIPQWHLPPFHHVITMIEVPVVSPVANSLPGALIADELTDGRGDLLTANQRTSLPFSVHRPNALNHAEALWDSNLQLQVLRILGEEPSFWE